MWQRYNQTSKIFEKSVDNGVTWAPLPLNASIITEGTIPNVAYTNQQNVFTQIQTISIAGASSKINFIDNARPDNLKRWDIGSIQSGYFMFSTMNDDGTLKKSCFYLDVNGGAYVAGNLQVDNSIYTKNGYAIYPGRVDVSDGYIQTSFYLATHNTYGLYSNTGLYLGGSLWLGSNIYSGGSIYPGRSDSPGTQQSAWFLASHGSYGLITNTGLFVTGQIWERNRATAIGEWIPFIPTHYDQNGVNNVTPLSSDCGYALVGNICFWKMHFNVQVNVAGVSIIYATIPVNSGAHPSMAGLCQVYSADRGWIQGWSVVDAYNRIAFSPDTGFWAAGAAWVNHASGWFFIG